MKTNSSPNTQARSHQAIPANFPTNARRILSFLQHLPVGQLTIIFPDGEPWQCGEDSCEPNALRATIRIHDWQTITRLLRSGDIGLAESFRDQQWSSPHLTELLRLCIVNRQHLESLIYGSWWGSWWYRLKQAWHHNSKTGSKHNIHAHYDLGNDFYALWLDEGFNYSSAYFAGNTEQTLAQAQAAKTRLALDSAQVNGASRVLEVGCGWGALATLAVQERGASVVGITLSEAQLAHGQAKLAKNHILPHQAQFHLMDYRDAAITYRHKPFDAIISIEMFEAVGREYWRDYFAMIRDCLKKNGRACIQTITLREDLYARYCHGTDFIQQYIFPGGFLPSSRAFIEEAERAGLMVIEQKAFGMDYAETLNRWQARFLSRRDQVRSLGFDEAFIRIWEFYLSYCSAAFAEGNTDVVQFTLMHRATTQASPIKPSRHALTPPHDIRFIEPL